MPIADIASAYADAVTTVFSSPIAAKAWFASAAAVLVAVQLRDGGADVGRLRGVVPLADATAKRVHRWSGRLAVLCTVPVVFHCVLILGFRATDVRVAIHSIVGSFVFYGALAAKIAFLRDPRHPAWALPVAGGAVAALLVALWLTSSLWYFTRVRFGF